MTESRQLLQHFLAALAYRTQKAVRGAPEEFANYRIGPTSRTPKELVWHMASVVGYARTMFHGGRFTPPELPTFADWLDAQALLAAALDAVDMFPNTHHLECIAVFTRGAPH